jgi:hypothetical protein
MPRITLASGLFDQRDHKVRSWKSLCLPQVRHELRWDRYVHFINVAPGPPFGGLEARYHRVAHVFEMFRGVAVWRAVTTADVSTRQAQP